MLLVINRSEHDGKLIAEMFYAMGILAVNRRPADALSEISTCYSAVLVVDPDRLPDMEDYLSRLDGYCPTLPCYALCQDPTALAGISRFRSVYEHGAYSSRLAAQMIRDCEQLGVRSIGDYRLAGINASCTHAQVCYFDAPLPLTRTEAMIVRFLIRTYPQNVPTAQLLRYAFAPTHAPGLSNVRTHICSINRKFRALTERNLISVDPGIGYRILTPEREMLTV